MIKKWKKIKEESIKIGFRKVKKKTFQMPHGRMAEFDIKDEGPVVCILGLSKENKIILAQQFRPGPEEILLEMPGGGIDGEESPEDAAKREFLEETGYTGNFSFAGTSLDCGYSTRVRYNFVAINCYKLKDQELDENEFAEVVEMSLNDFREHLRSGQLTDVDSGYLGLDFLNLL